MQQLFHFVAIRLIAAQILYRCSPGGEIGVTVNRHGPPAREGWPVKGGIPLAAGELTDSSAIALIDQDGTATVVQAEPLGRWEDGSIKIN